MPETSLKVILVTGIPGSGKTTVAKRLAERLPRSAYISADTLRHMVISGYRNPNQPWDDEMRNQYALSFQNQADLAKNFLEQGFVVVIDDVVRKGELYTEWLKHFEGIPHRVVLLMPRLEEALKRNRARREGIVPERTLYDLNERYERSEKSGWIVIDNSEQTVEETVDEILTGISETRG